MPMWSGPNATSSYTVGLNSWSSGSWNTSPTRARIRRTEDRSTSVPPIRTVPWVGSWMPLRCSISVLLPAPFGPTSATFSPRGDREVEPLQRLEAVRVAEVEVLDRDRGRRAGLEAIGLALAVRMSVAVVVVPVRVRVLVHVLVGGCRPRVPRVDRRHRSGPHTLTATVNATHPSRISASVAYSTGSSDRLWRWRNSPSKPRACIAA